MGYKGHFITFNIWNLTEDGKFHKIKSSGGKIKSFLKF